MIHVVILAGGNGSRLWPLYGANNAKPFIQNYDGVALLSQTLQYASSIKGVGSIIIVTNHHLAERVREECVKLHRETPLLLTIKIIIEPSNKDTANAVVATLASIDTTNDIDKISENQVIILPSDHLINNKQAFLAALEEASLLAKETGNITLLGVRPKQPDTNYGYIRHEGNKVVAFYEKPCLSDVEKYYQERENILWNCGIICANIRSMIKAVDDCQNILIPKMRDIILDATISKDEAVETIEITSGQWDSLLPQSIDYMVLEHIENLSVIVVDFDWVDIGNWRSYSEAYSKELDASGNSLSDMAIALESDNCYIYSGGKTIAALGVKNLIIVETEDVVLVMDKNRPSLVKELKTILDKDK